MRKGRVSTNSVSYTVEFGRMQQVVVVQAAEQRAIHEDAAGHALPSLRRVLVANLSLPHCDMDSV